MNRKTSAALACLLAPILAAGPAHAQPSFALGSGP